MITVYEPFTVGVKVAEVAPGTAVKVVPETEYHWYVPVVAEAVKVLLFKVTVGLAGFGLTVMVVATEVEVQPLAVAVTV